MAGSREAQAAMEVEQAVAAGSILSLSSSLMDPTALWFLVEDDKTSLNKSSEEMSLVMQIKSGIRVY